MNVYEYKYYDEAKDEMFHSTRQSGVEWNMRNHIICTKMQFFQTNLKEKVLKNYFSSIKTYKPHVKLYTGNITQMLGSRQRNPVEFRTYSFLLASFLEQSSKDCIGNTEHSNVNVNSECNSK